MPSILSVGVKHCFVVSKFMCMVCFSGLLHVDTVFIKINSSVSRKSTLEYLYL